VIVIIEHMYTCSGGQAFLIAYVLMIDAIKGPTPHTEALEIELLGNFYNPFGDC
jgi:hypothetical protein